MDVAFLPILLISYVLLPVLALLLLYVVVRRAVRDGIWDARRLRPDSPGARIDAPAQPPAPRAAPPTAPPTAPPGEPGPPAP